MTASEREKIREKIRDEILALGLEIENLAERVRPIPPDDAIGRLTRMEAIQAKSISEANLRSARVRLALLERAQVKVSDPAFGICTVCEEEIPVPRLLVLPYTTRCVSCSEE